MPEYECMPIERLSIKRMWFLGTFPAVLDAKFQIFLGGARTPLVCWCFTIQFTQKKGYKQDCRQIYCQSIRLYITLPYWGESKSVSKGCGNWENREVRINLAKNIMVMPLKVRCKTLYGPTLPRAMLQFWVRVRVRNFISTRKDYQSKLLGFSFFKETELLWKTSFLPGKIIKVKNEVHMFWLYPWFCN